MGFGSGCPSRLWLLRLRPVVRFPLAGTLLPRLLNLTKHGCRLPNASPLSKGDTEREGEGGNEEEDHALVQAISNIPARSIGRGLEGFSISVSRTKSEGSMVGVLSNRVDREDVAAGDHIYSWRAAYIYAHHGIYAGDGMVIHFTRAAGREIGTGTFLDKFLFSSSPTTVHGPPCQKCGHLVKSEGVIMSCLDCFLDGGNLYLFDYAVSPAFFLAKARGGTCTMAPSDAAHLVVQRAQYLLDNGFGMYNLFKNNCEDFAIYCKTELLVETIFSVGRSGQLSALTAAFSAVASSPLRFLTTSVGGLAVVTSGMYCMGRYVSDIGVRRDVIKVPVARLVENSAQNVATAPQGSTQTEATALGGSSELPSEFAKKETAL